MQRDECWMSFSEALDQYMDATARLGHFGESRNRKQAEEDLQVAKDHMDALVSVPDEPQSVSEERNVIAHMMLVAQRAEDEEIASDGRATPKSIRRAICKAFLKDKNLLRKLKEL